MGNPVSLVGSLRRKPNELDVETKRQSTRKTCILLAGMSLVRVSTSITQQAELTDSEMWLVKRI